MKKKTEFRSGFVTIIGRPNVGKSTLLNYLAARKIAIVSQKPQTTRHKIRAVVNRPGAQLILIDTPGLHKPQDNLGVRMNKVVLSAVAEADAVLFMVDAAAGIGAGDAYIAAQLGQTKTPKILAVNKIDLINGEELRRQTKAAADLGPFKERFSISALRGRGVKGLTSALINILPAGPQYYPEDFISDQPENILIAEFIREQVLALTREELPYSVAARVEEVELKGTVLKVSAFIYVERNSQKGIIIGKGGGTLREIGTRARLELEKLLGNKIYLDLRVKVKKKWRRQEHFLNDIGY